MRYPSQPGYRPMGDDGGEEKSPQQLPSLLSVDPNQSPVDFYTLMHIQFGHFMRSVGVSFPTAIVVSVVWEWIIEPIYKQSQPQLFPVPSQDSVVNRIMDTVAVGAGWYIGDTQIKQKRGR